MKNKVKRGVGLWGMLKDIDYVPYKPLTIEDINNIKQAFDKKPLPNKCDVYLGQDLYDLSFGDEKTKAAAIRRMAISAFKQSRCFILNFIRINNGHAIAIPICIAA